MTQAPAAPVAPGRELIVVLIGNPNTGKTTLFNAITGLRHKVGNYAGVTVETKTGRASLGGVPIAITDVPGTYSLSPRSIDEMLAVDILLGHRRELERPDVVVCILDASNLERNLFLATQVLELGVPVVFTLNMMDVAKEHGILINVPELEKRLGVPVVPVQANKKIGLEELGKTILRQANQGTAPLEKPQFPADFTAQVEHLRSWLIQHKESETEPFMLQRALIDAGGFTEKMLVGRHGEQLAEVLHSSRAALKEARCPVPGIEARVRYSWISEKLAEVVKRPAVRKVTFSDRLDKVIMHRVWGLGIFLGVMFLIFQTIFEWATPVQDMIQTGVDTVKDVVSPLIPPGPLHQLVTDGIIEGVGGVLAFLPQIVFLFGYIAILEDCGYMARAAFLMDKLMSRCGLSGKSFIPMLSSFACAIPGVMATRTIEDPRDRLTTILVAPLMSCSARLTVYTLMIGAFIPDIRVAGIFGLQGLVLFSMYMIGLVVAPIVAFTLKRTLLRGDTPIFMMELPSYKWPSPAAVIQRMFERAWMFIKRAGTIILASTIVVWALAYFPHLESTVENYVPKIDAIGQQVSVIASKIEGSPVENPAASQKTAENKLAAIVDEIGAIQARLGPKSAKTGGDSETPIPVSAERQQLADLRHQAGQLEADVAAAFQDQSFLGYMGHYIAPVVRPLGWDWRIGMAALASFPAREVVVSALGTIYSVEMTGDEDADDTGIQAALKRATWPDGSPVFTIPVALSLMVFFALCAQCAATLAIIKRETNSWGWAIFTFVYMTGLAYLGALITYQIGSRIG